MVLFLVTFLVPFFTTFMVLFLVTFLVPFLLLFSLLSGAFFGNFSAPLFRCFFWSLFEGFSAVLVWAFVYKGFWTFGGLRELWRHYNLGHFMVFFRPERRIVRK
jgi:hypothetical protein